jgi:tRNA G18 (ribose-2'-O)-methylase SpoU
LKKAFRFSKSKFLSFPKEKQHKKCAELLRGFFTHPFNREEIRSSYEELVSWMGVAIAQPLEDMFHYHLKESNQSCREYDFLEVRTQDRKEASPWMSVHTYLDGLRSCHNVGSIVRTIEAFRLGPLHLSSDMMAPDHPLIKKVSMGASAFVSIDHGASFETLPRPWIALETVNSAHSWSSFPYPSVCTLFLGNEERGIRPEVLSQCDHIVTIPLFGIKNSLNVANAFAILAAEVSLAR